MRRIFPIIVVLFCAFSGSAETLLFDAQFTGIPSDPCRDTTRPSTILCYDGSLDGNGNLLDLSGENLVKYSEDFGSWTPTRVSVTTNTIKAPDGTFTGDVVVEDASAATTHYVYDTGTALTINTPTTVTVWAQPINRTWIRVANSASTAGAYFNLSGAGSVGTLLLATDASIYYDRGWYKCTVTLTSPASLNLFIQIAEADNDDTFDGLSQNSVALWGAHAYQRNVQWATKRSPYISTNGVAKPRHDLAPTGGPTRLYDAQYFNRNRKIGRLFDGATQWYSKAAHDSFKIFDTNHTITLIDDYYGSGTRAVWSNGSNAGGASGFSEATRQRCSYGTGAASIDVYGPTITPYGSQVQQCTRSGNTGIMYSNGTAGSSTDVTGGGVDTALTFYVGRYTNAGSEFFGGVHFLRIDSEALSAETLAYERQYLEGWAQSRKNKAWTFSRTTVGYIRYNDNSMYQAPPNSPRIGLDGGILIETQSNQIQRYSQTLNSWSNPTRLSVTPDTAIYLAPDGTATADILHEDNTAANTHVLYDSSVSVTNGQNYTLSAFVRYINREWVYLTTLSGTYKGCYFNIRYGRLGTCTASTTGRIIPSYNGYYKIEITRTAEAATMANWIYIAEADSDSTFDGLDQDSMSVWGIKLELGNYASSYVASGATVPIAQTTDAMSIAASDTRLPNVGCATCLAKKLRMSIEIKCPFNYPSTPAAQRYIFTIGGAASSNNQVQFYISSTGRLYASFSDSVGTAHSGFSAVDPVALTNWVNFDVYFDTSDLTTFSFKINGSSTGITYINNSGTGSLDLSGLNLQFGSRVGGQVDGCYHRKLKVFVE